MRKMVQEQKTAKGSNEETNIDIIEKGVSKLLERKN